MKIIKPSNIKAEVIQAGAYKSISINPGFREKLHKAIKEAKMTKKEIERYNVDEVQLKRAISKMKSPKEIMEYVHKVNEAHRLMDMMHPDGIEEVPAIIRLLDDITKDL